ncbi:hypothetical protein MPOCJGCO_1476 [Methylobacterium trifolii]|uniref:Uncharacterized protein n=1 Tax=Methylobacterium trifolii TaxID=1003092 RepID=A0ABQ4TZV2_9HYPH|nr:hypothetical protein MPOCJGCO_1476 [Methylobacterium trifolii]
MDLGAAELLRGHDLVGDGLHHVGAGDEHVARVAHHEDEVGHGRRVDVAACARPHDHRDLRYHARSHHVAAEHLAVAAERGHALLDTRPAGVENADDRGAHLQRHVLNFYDFLRVGLGKRAPEHREVLRKQKYGAAVHRAPAGDDAVAGDLLLLHAEIGGAVLHEHVELLERPVVEEEFDAFARGELATFVLGVHALLTAAEAGLRAPLLELLENVLHGMRLRAGEDVRSGPSRASVRGSLTVGDAGPLARRFRPRKRGFYRLSAATSAAASNSIRRSANRASASASRPHTAA